MKKLLSFFTTLGRQLKSSLTRFPETIAATYLLAILWIILNHYYNLIFAGNEIPLSFKTLHKVILMLAIALPYTAAVKLADERFFKKPVFRILGDLVILVSVIIGSILMPDNLVEREILLIFIVTGIGYFAFMVLPYLIKRAFFPIYLLKLATNFFITFLYSLVLYLGIISIIFAVEQLFDLTISSDLYMDLWIFIAGFFSVTFFLGNVPAKNTLFEETDYTKIYRYLFTIIVIPLLGIFTFILYAYFAKIIANGELPESIITSLVLWYGLIGCVILFLVEPLLQSNLIAKWFRRIFPFALLVPVGMMFYSLYLRIHQYGITPPRYYCVLAGILILGTSVYTIFHKNFIPQVLMLFLMPLLLISAVGPLSAYQMTMHDQNTQFVNLLTFHEMLNDDGTIKPNSNLTNEEQNEVLDYIHYAEEIACLDLLKALPDTYSDETAKDILGFEDNYVYDQSTSDYHFFSYNLYDSTDLDISGYDHMLYIDEYPSNTSQYSSSIDPATNILSIYQNENLLIEVNLTEWNTNLQKLYPNSGFISLEDATIIAENDQIRVKILFDNYSYYYYPDSEKYEDFSYSFYLFIGDN